MRKNNARIIKKKKKRKKRKNYTQALGELKCAYTKKKWLKFRIEQSSIRGILNFRAKGVKYFGPLKTKWKCPYIRPAVGQTEARELLLLVLYECTSQLSKNMPLKLYDRVKIPLLGHYISLKLSTNCWCWRIFFLLNFVILEFLGINRVNGILSPFLKNIKEVSPGSIY